MPNLIKDLVLNRVDLVDEGANSAAFIELYKRKENNSTMTIEEILSKMKPEHAAVVTGNIESLQAELTKAKADLDTASTQVSTLTTDLTKAKEDLTKAQEDLSVAKAKGKDECECDGEADDDGVCKVCGKPKKEDEVMKSLPASARAVLAKMRLQKETAEAELRKAKDAEATAEAIAKAATFKALPVEKEALASVIKGASPELLSMLSTINAAIEGTAFTEVGKSAGAKTGGDAWARIEKAADEVAKRDNITKQKAVTVVLKEQPALYKEYLQEV